MGSRSGCSGIALVGLSARSPRLCVQGSSLCSGSLLGGLRDHSPLSLCSEITTSLVLRHHSWGGGTQGSLIPGSVLWDQSWLSAQRSPLVLCSEITTSSMPRDPSWLCSGIIPGGNQRSLSPGSVLSSGITHLWLRAQRSPLVLCLGIDHSWGGLRSLRPGSLLRITPGPVPRDRSQWGSGDHLGCRQQGH